METSCDEERSCGSCGVLRHPDPWPASLDSAWRFARRLTSPIRGGEARGKGRTAPAAGSRPPSPLSPATVQKADGLNELHKSDLDVAPALPRPGDDMRAISSKRFRSYASDWSLPSRRGHRRRAMCDLLQTGSSIQIGGRLSSRVAISTPLWPSSAASLV